MASKVFGVGALVVALAVALAVAGYWYGSPYLVINSMKSAIEDHDAERFNQYVDYPRLRVNLKRRFSAMMAEKLDEAAGHAGNDFLWAGTVLGSMVGQALVDQAIDIMVRPELVMRAMERGEVSINSMPRPEAIPAESRPQREKRQWRYSREDMDKLIVYPSSDREDGNTNGFVFERSGFATWRLTAIHPPAR